MKPFAPIAGTALLLATAMAARAADLPASAPSFASVIDTSTADRFFIRAGIVGLVLNESASIGAMGAKIPGATIGIEPQVTASLEAGYYITPNVAIAVTGGLPPKAVIEAAGTIAPLGRLGSIVYGPTTATLQYHVLGFGRLQPYVGIGPAVLFVFSEKDGAAQRLRVDSSVGVVGQIGANYMFDAHWGIFGDVKAAWLGTEARGFLGPVPIKAEVRLDPVTFSAGLIHRF
ncbi:OmpW/AlkL family protein [Methylobacterium sp. J-092]|jgi:outer membrane protein|uniref:OmpW/AlkL family protein n=1 Tax=Methylobacterium sp. J-092 TaxID=2836667 RepID=UPI001FB8A8F9|nr:OmpW family outer membrane protein [Methylobacterium sp. J-092]MCJ2009597.1 hypothetical protein [Methylobacterium sp. J-092]